MKSTVSYSYSHFKVFPFLHQVLSDLPQVSMSLSEDISDYTEGDTATISCIADSNPKADILWYRDGSGEIVGRRETLKIMNIKRDQAGVYICKANNSVGQSDTKKIDIQVKCEYPLL